MPSVPRKYVGWARSVLAPRERLLPGLGARLNEHPRFIVALLVFFRRLPGRWLSRTAQHNVSRPLLRRMTTHLDVPVSGGFRMRLDTTDGIGRVLAVGGSWEPHVSELFRAHLSPGDICVDVGANVGYFTLLAATLVGPSGHVFALEPAPQIHAELVASVELNGFENVTALCVAAGSEAREALLDNPGQSVLSSIRVDSGEVPVGSVTVAVSVRSVASLIEGSDIGRVRLVKIDVEGYEFEVLRGLEPLFAEGGRFAVIVELHGREAVPLVVELVERYGLTAQTIGDNGGHPHLEPWTEHKVGPSGRHILLTP